MRVKPSPRNFGFGVLVPGVMLPLFLFLGTLIGGALGRTIDRHVARKQGRTSESDS